MISIRLMLFSAILSLPLGALSQTRDTILWTTDVWEKASYQDQTGAYFDLMRAIFPESEYELKHQFLPYKRGLQYAGEGMVDIFSLCIPSDLFYSAQNPWAQESIGVLFYADRTDAWAGVDTLRNKNIAIHNNTALLPFVQSLKLKLIKSADREKSLQMLEKGRADYLLGIYINLQRTVTEQDPEGMDKFRFEPLNVVTCYPGFTQSERGKQLKAQWDAGMKRLHDEGQLAPIYRKWDLEYPRFSWQ